jgi:transposase-like protein
MTRAAAETGRGSDDQLTVDQIAERVVEALRDELHTIASELLAARAGEQLTVDAVAQRLGVARSTVYSHWREWGGYKLGPGAKASIRFDEDSLPVGQDAHRAKTPAQPTATRAAGRQRRPRRKLLGDAPRLIRPLDAAS